MIESAGEAGYLELLRGNSDFRRLWIGNVVSLLGDWFNTIALYALVNELTGSPLALGTVFICKMLPAALASPLAGILVDRLNRRRVMITTDLLRALVVLGFLLVDDAREVWLLYVLTAAQVIFGAAFEPARNASLPNVVSARELLTANTLMSATWSIMLAFGAAAGGIATELLGTSAVFLVDSATYLISAWFVWRAHIPQRTDRPEEGPLLATATAGILEGWDYLRRRGEIARIAVVKATFFVGGGGLVYMLALLGEEVTPNAAAFGIGLLLAFRGLGTAFGPVVARSWFPNQRLWPLLITGAIVFAGLIYTSFAFVPWTVWIAGLVFLAHVAGGSEWVLSAVLLQERSEDRMRGRVFATEWLLLMLSQAASILVASLLLESGVVTLRSAFLVFGLVEVAAGLLWGALCLRAEARTFAAASGRLGAQAPAAGAVSEGRRVGVRQEGQLAEGSRKAPSQSGQ